MSHPRISLALQADAFRLPPTGEVAIFGPARDISDLGPNVVVQSHLATDHAYWQARHVPVVLALATRPQLSVVFLPRAKALARGLVAQALAETDGPVVVDGQKTDGIDSLLKEVRGKAQHGFPHGRPQSANRVKDRIGPALARGLCKNVAPLIILQ